MNLLIINMTLGLFLAIGINDLHAAESARLNVIVVLVDDMGSTDLSCFGGKQVQTPNIDRLAAEGLRFHSFYVNSPICSPSRVALTTGQYPHRWRITSYLDNRQANERRGVAHWLDPQAPVLARELQRAGYMTGHFGKWHMGGQRDVGDAPLIVDYGFHVSLTNFEGLGPRVLPILNAFNGKPTRQHDLGSAALGCGQIRWAERSTITSEFVTAAIGFIDQAQASGKPFFLNLWPDDVHSPFFPSRAARAATDNSKRVLYYSVLAEMDRQLGSLFDRIQKDSKLRDTTLIALLSDNGHEDGAGSSTPYRGGKTWLYEGGIRSPLIVWCPSRMPRTTIGCVNYDSVMCALDLNRSLYGITNTPLPKGHVLDGEDVATTLLGCDRHGRVAPIFWRRPPDRPGTVEQDNPDLAVRNGKWKFCMNFNGSNPELYDIEADVQEANNLAGARPDIVAQLKNAIEAWNATLPADRPQ